jgi:hypothetical protein
MRTALADSHAGFGTMLAADDAAGAETAGNTTTGATQGRRELRPNMTSVHPHTDTHTILGTSNTLPLRETQHCPHTATPPQHAPPAATPRPTPSFHSVQNLPLQQRPRNTTHTPPHTPHPADLPLALLAPCEEEAEGPGPLLPLAGAGDRRAPLAPGAAAAAAGPGLLALLAPEATLVAVDRGGSCVQSAGSEGGRLHGWWWGGTAPRVSREETRDVDVHQGRCGCE